MKALLMKDVKILTVNMKFYFILILAYTLLGAIVKNLGIFQFYPILLFAMFPVTSLSFDERCHWFRYGVTLPCKRRDLVLSKYVLGLTGMFFIALFILIINLFLTPLLTQSTPDFLFLSFFILAALSGSMISMDIILPVSFLVGTEKSRIIYLICVISLCAMPAILNGMYLPAISTDLPSPGILISILFCLSLLLTFLSMAVSIRIFEKKEL